MVGDFANYPIKLSDFWSVKVFSKKALCSSYNIFLRKLQLLYFKKNACILLTNFILRTCGSANNEYLVDVQYGLHNKCTNKTKLQIFFNDSEYYFCLKSQVHVKWFAICVDFFVYSISLLIYRFLDTTNLVWLD